MQNLLSQAYDLLKQDERLLSTEGDLLKNKIQELAYKLDEKLIEMLLSDVTMKEKFFVYIGKVIVFDQKKFVQFINNKQFLPDSYTAFKNKIGLTDSRDQFVSESNDVVLDRPYKDCILAGGQDKEDAKRDEIFYNEVLGSDQIDRLLDPKVFTNFKKYTVDGEVPLDKGVEGFARDENGLITDNLIIKGNNLLALHSLRKQFAGKIKLIYIDPPYNTGSDSFKYNDKFNHSTWLTFMKNRLEVAKELLKEDGVIFVQCDDNEQAYLKVLMDEVFGRNSFVSNIVTRSTPNARDYGLIAQMHEHIIFYAKNISYAKTNLLLMESKEFDYEDEIGKFNIHPLYNSNVNFHIENRKNLYYPFYVDTNKIDKDGFFEISLEKKQGLIEVFPPKSIKDGVQFVWRRGKEKSLNNLNKEIVGYKTRDGEIRIIQKMRGTEQLARNIWMETEISNRRATEDLQKLFHKKVFSFPKSEYLLQKIISISTQPGDIVLDYHLGSGTTCAVAHKMGRQYIGVEQMDYIETIAVERMKKVIEGEQGGISKVANRKGGGEFIYMEIAQNNEKLIQAIHNAEHSQELISLYHQLKESSFINYKVDIKTIDAHSSEFETLSLEDMKRFLSELIDKNALYINYSEINDESYAISAEDKALNKKFYQ